VCHLYLAEGCHLYIAFTRERRETGIMEKRRTRLWKISRAQPTFQRSKIGGSITEMTIDAIRFAVGSREDVRSSVWRFSLSR
jgi:hypothetical protein